MASSSRRGRTDRALDRKQLAARRRRSWPTTTRRSSSSSASNRRTRVTRIRPSTTTIGEAQLQRDDEGQTEGLRGRRSRRSTPSTRSSRIERPRPRPDHLHGLVSGPPADEGASTWRRRTSTVACCASRSTPTTPRSSTRRSPPAAASTRCSCEKLGRGGGRAQTFGPPEKDKKYSVERTRQGRHRLGGGRGRGRAARPAAPAGRLPQGRRPQGIRPGQRGPPARAADGRRRTATRWRPTRTCIALPVDGGSRARRSSTWATGGKVRGAERKKERFLLSFVGVDSAGQPRANDQIKMHFDQSTWGDPTIYSKYPAPAAWDAVSALRRAAAERNHSGSWGCSAEAVWF